MAALVVAYGLRGLDFPGVELVGARAVPDAVTLNADAPVDDVLVELCGGGRLFIQAKRRLSFGRPLREVVAQWTEAARNPDFDPARDRLVAVAGTVVQAVRDLDSALRRKRQERAGGFTQRERRALERFLKLIDGLSAEERTRLLQAAVVLPLQVEESYQPDSERGRLLLDGHVVAHGEGAQAWEDLIAAASRAAKDRYGYTIEGWLTRLRIRKRWLIVDAEGARSARLEARYQAVRRYREGLVQRGSLLSLRSLGADLPPLPLGEADAVVRVRPRRPEAEDTRERDLLWAQRRRGRTLLTGLPGGGKSVGLQMLAGRWAALEGWPLPVLVRLPELLAEIDRGRGMVDALIHLATYELGGIDRSLVVDAIREALRTGRLALFLDGLDETRARRHEVVERVGKFLEDVNQAVELVVATRDAGYAQARTLGLAELELVPPQKIERTVKAILRGAADQKGVADESRDRWVADRMEWIDDVVNRDPTLKETPLIPILLALVASQHEREALPTTRAVILRTVVEDVVRRHERLARKARALELGRLRDIEAARALLDAFAAEAWAILSAGGTPARAIVERGVASYLRDRWNLAPGEAEVAATGAVDFWDESGIFLARTERDVIEPRVQLLGEVGLAMWMAHQSDYKVCEWVGQLVEDPDSAEALLLAAGLSPVAAGELARLAATTSTARPAMLAARAVREGAHLGTEALEAVVLRLRCELRLGDRHAWGVWQLLAELPVPVELRSQLVDELAAFPAEHQLVARALAVLGWREHGVAADAVLLDVLRLGRLPQLAAADEAEEPGVSGWFIDRAKVRATLGAAERLLPGNPDLAQLLVAAATEHVPAGSAIRLYELLEREGHGGLVRKVNEEMWTRWRDHVPDAVNEIQRLKAAEQRFLEIVAGLSGSDVALDDREARRLSSLSSLCATLRIDKWPSRTLSSMLERAPEAIKALVNIVAQLGGLDACLLATQARVVLHELGSGDDAIFWMLFDAPDPAKLDQWDRVDEEEARRVLRGLFRFPQDVAVVAARVLGQAPSREQAIRELEADLSELNPLNRRLAAHAILALSGESWVSRMRQWVASGDSVLRHTTAEIASRELGRRPDLIDVVRRLVVDVDDGVRAGVISNVERNLPPLDAEITRSLTETVLNGEATGWLCMLCGHSNGADASRCTECRGSAPQSKKEAERALSRLGLKRQ